jgi:F0F1-type ATP synthase assembly protein I
MTSPAIRKRLVQISFLVLIQAVLLFLSAWKWDWWNAWAYLGLYLAFLVSYLTIPITLGSLWALIPTSILIVNLFIHTALEDRTLQNELEGYKEYTQRVRYRLLLEVW